MWKSPGNLKPTIHKREQTIRLLDVMNLMRKDVMVCNASIVNIQKIYNNHINCNQIYWRVKSSIN